MVDRLKQDLFLFSRLKRKQKKEGETREKRRDGWRERIIFLFAPFSGQL
jgi:hypothetical protein